MTKALIRPACTPATIAMMIIGFMIFWPLGLAMIAYILWGDRLDTFKQDVNRATDKFSKDLGSTFKTSTSSARTGNVAFDDWREEELDRIEKERRKLDEMRHDFDEYLRELRRAKDKEEFDTFMHGRKKPAKKGPKSKQVPNAGN